MIRHVHRDANEREQEILPKFRSDLIIVRDLGSLHGQSYLLVVLAIALKLAGLRTRVAATRTAGTGPNVRLVGQRAIRTDRLRPLNRGRVHQPHSSRRPLRVIVSLCPVRHVLRSVVNRRNQLARQATLVRSWSQTIVQQFAGASASELPLGLLRSRISSLVPVLPLEVSPLHPDDLLRPGPPVIEKLPVLRGQISLRFGRDAACSLARSRRAASFEVLQSRAGARAVTAEVRHLSGVLTRVQAGPVADQPAIQATVHRVRSGALRARRRANVLKVLPGVQLLPVSLVLALMPPLLLLVLRLPRRGDLVLSVLLDLRPDLLDVLRRGRTVLALQIAPELLPRCGRVDAQVQILPVLRVVDLEAGLIRVADGDLPVPVRDADELLVRPVEVGRYPRNVFRYVRLVVRRVQVVHIDRLIQRRDRLHASQAADARVVRYRGALPLRRVQIRARVTRVLLRVLVVQAVSILLDLVRERLLLLGALVVQARVFRRDHRADTRVGLLGDLVLALAVEQQVRQRFVRLGYQLLRVQVRQRVLYVHRLAGHVVLVRHLVQQVLRLRDLDVVRAAEYLADVRRDELILLLFAASSATLGYVRDIVTLRGCLLHDRIGHR